MRWASRRSTRPPSKARDKGQHVSLCLEPGTGRDEGVRCRTRHAPRLAVSKEGGGRSASIARWTLAPENACLPFVQVLCAGTGRRRAVWSAAGMNEKTLLIWRVRRMNGDSRRRPKLRRQLEGGAGLLRCVVNRALLRHPTSRSLSPNMISRETSTMRYASSFSPLS